jgi:hypothetical protein
MLYKAMLPQISGRTESVGLENDAPSSRRAWKDRQFSSVTDQSVEQKEQQPGCPKNPTADSAFTYVSGL